jgi:hypothetical protein
VYPADPTWFAIATLYGLGLAPSLQNIWENIPLSFVLDWFTNMSSRFKAVDLQVLSVFLAVEDIQVSYKITGDFDARSRVLAKEYLLSINYDDSDITSSFYRRELITGLPVLSDGLYDYKSVSQNPSFGILGSLTYQFLSLGK